MINFVLNIFSKNTSGSQDGDVRFDHLIKVKMLVKNYIL